MHIRFILGLIFLYLISTVSLAQQAVAKPVDHEFRLAPYFNLPQESLLLTDDTASTILINPARAVTFQKGFFYLTYFGIGGDNNPPNTISLNSLFEAAGSKWLFSLLTNRSSTETDRQTNEPYIRPDKYSQALIDESICLKLSNICNSATNHSSFGLFLSYKKTKDNYSRASAINYLEDVDYSKTEDENKFSSYQCGIEYSYFNSALDLICGIQYQKAFSNEKNSYQYFNTVVDTNNISTSTETHNFNEVEYNPATIGFRTSLFLKSNWLFEDDYFSFTLSSYYSENNRKARFDMYSVNYIGIGPPDILVEIEKAFDENETAKGITFRAGYNYSYRLTDVKLIGGLIASIIYDKYTVPGISGNTSVYQKADYSFISGILSLPVMIEYMPANYCQVYGGLIYNYSYRQYKWDINSRVIGSTYLTDKNELNKNDRFISETNFYAGINLTHPEGIQLCCFVNSNFSDFSGWTISIGYLF